MHQAYELWFKQILHEVDSVRAIFGAAPVDERLVNVAVARLERVAVIQQLLLQQLGVVETMKPVDFLDFRDYLYPASGFQSVQFRLVENALGLRASERIQYGQKGYCSYLAAADAAVVSGSETVPSLHDVIESWLERTPFLEGVSADVSGFTWWDHYKNAVTVMLREDEAAILAHPALEGSSTREVALKDLAATRKHFDTVLDAEQYAASRARGERRLSYRALQAALLITLYPDEPILQQPARLLSALLDIDGNLTAWRGRHALMVHRMLGVKMGTGGSSGYHYLRATAERHRVFADLFNLSTFLIPRAMLPPLPARVRARLDFVHASEASTATEGGAEIAAHAAPHSPAWLEAAAAGGAAVCPMGHS